MPKIADNLAAVQERIAAACDRAGRAPEDVQLIAVGKKFPAPIIREAAEAGLTLFGENRVQEAKAKISDCPGHLRWHFIGNLQTNKCRTPSPCLISCTLWIAASGRRTQQTLRTGCQSHARTFGGECLWRSKQTRLHPEAAVAAMDAFFDFPQLELHGLMTMAPFSRHPESARPYFQKLRELKNACEDQLGAPLPELSMGMSGDYEIAIEEGATLIRLGTTLFGPRVAANKG